MGHFASGPRLRHQRAPRKGRTGSTVNGHAGCRAGAKINLHHHDEARGDATAAATARWISAQNRY